MDKESILSKAKTLTAQLSASNATAKTGTDPDAPSWVGQVAVLTGVLAALTGFLTVRATTLTNQAIYESNQAILSQTQASDAWSEYQANSIKAHIIEMQLLPSVHLNAADHAKLMQMDTEVRGRQPVSKETAAAKTKEREEHLQAGLRNLNLKDTLGYASMIAQLGIALASVAALTKKRMVFYIAAAAGVLSIGITAYVFISAYLMSH